MSVSSMPADIRIAEDEMLQLPDYRFVIYCFEQFGLNRGIYNTIDEWLYDQGYVNIIERRRELVRFLSAVQAGGRKQGDRFLKFGKGGLMKRLGEFVEANA